jgi:predicted Zn-dependent protease
MRFYVSATRPVHDSHASMIELRSRFARGCMLAAALASAVPAPLVAQSAPAVRLPSLGDAGGEDFGVGTERRLGEQIMREVRRDPAYFDDPLLLEYLQSLWSPLLAAARARGNIGADIDGAFAWQAFLVRDRSVNAFALPGGYVGVHLGLMAATGSRDELASVLAHELSHVTQRHIARSIANASRQSLVGMAALLLGVLAASRANSTDATQAVIVGSQAAMAQGQLNFSRDMEREADRIGWGVFQDSGFAPAGMAAMFERLETASRLTDSGAYPYLRSHPLTIDRIGEARSRVEASSAAAAPVHAPLMHALMQARARVLMDPAVQSLRRAQALDSAGGPGRERVAALYGSALASLELRDPARAQSALDAALPLLRGAAAGADDEARTRGAFTLAQAQIALAQSQPERALALLDAAAPAGAARGWLFARAQAALAVARSGNTPPALRQSLEALQTWVAESRGDASAWQWLAQCAERLGLKLRALRAEGEAQAAGGDLAGAIDRLRAAQRQARSGPAPDFIEASIIDSRLRELTAQRRAELAELRGGAREERPPGP